MSVFQKLKVDNILKESSNIDLTGFDGSEKSLLISDFYKANRVNTVVIVPDQKDCEKVKNDISFFAGKTDIPVEIFPEYNILPFKSLSYHSDIAAQRIKILYKIIENSNPSIIITTSNAALQRIIPRNELSDYAELIMKNEDVDRDELIAKLISGGYLRTPIVEEPGEFCIRGGIIDIFSPSYDDPLRIEFFGDTVESIRFFSPLSQRKLKDIDEAIILPAREVIVQKKDADSILSRIRKQASLLDLKVTDLRKIVESFKEEGSFPGIESVLPLVYTKLDSFVDYTPDDTAYFVYSYEDSYKASLDYENKAVENYENALNNRKLCVDPKTYNLTWDDISEKISTKKSIFFKTLEVANNKLKKSYEINHNEDLSTKLNSNREKEELLSPLVDWIEDKRNSNYLTVLTCSTETQSKRLQLLLQPYGVEFFTSSHFPDIKRNKGLVYISTGYVSKGFVWKDLSLAIVTDDEIFGAKKRISKNSFKTYRSEITAFEDLQNGDIVVHKEHGLGKYDGLVKLTHAAITSDYLLIIFSGEDKLYLPVDRMGIIQKYIGVDGMDPILDKMGGKSWKKSRARIKENVEKMAGELLKLYAERKVQKGHAFGLTDSYFQDFEASFPYEETSGQNKAINEVLSDMESNIPMDRLVCGDVGYGKTEVALRAAFKAVNDSKQVAVLVPTTVLAEQHFKTFKERFKDYPININCLSRFKKPKEQKQIVKDLSEGKIDIIIGTHRLIQKDIIIPHLGLFVIDEEQRFGVKHKEKLKKIRSTVDVLTLTATPIPRTLHMSMMGMRDISLIETPPEERQSIISYISEYDDGVIKDAIKKELSRGGQAFFVHNNINTIYNIANHLQKIVPEVKIGVAHGRLTETELEKVMYNFINGETNMLVCTTIIESGLDIPLANTMLINRADRMGLAQLYQLRGRVGRSNRQAYAYLFIPDENLIGKNARKRLKVIMENSNLGSGFKIAMSDLQIRGGGTALGASQSGQIAAVGYDMFLELMDNAISELKGETVLEKLEPEINIPISTFFPESYIVDLDQRLLTYRRLAKMEKIKEISVLKEELTDRFGKMPEEATNILLKIMLRILSKQGGIKQLDLNGTNLSLKFSELHQTKPFAIVDLITKKPDVFKLLTNNSLQVKLKKGSMNQLLVQTKNLLKEIIEHVNPRLL
ncbi:MAG: transcription-repair coupling factor [Desulfobacterales bacterium]|nr:transcription-repair coupling factor [Desulfobacterales bacterium]MCP4160071.1 transcription-repair coupling factor [Deltaproteobacteria bacterium]